MARMVGISGANPGRTLARIENGERQPDADMIDRIGALTAGEVSAGDIQASRLAWLKKNRPEKFTHSDPPPVHSSFPEAAE